MRWASQAARASATRTRARVGAMHGEVPIGHGDGRHCARHRSTKGDLSDALAGRRPQVPASRYEPATVAPSSSSTQSYWIQ